MPDTYIPPDEYVEHKGIIVYHTYVDGDYNNPMEYWFTTDVNESQENEFDIRDLKCFNEDDDFKEIIKKAIDTGEIQ